jgi:hypothetical protein
MLGKSSTSRNEMADLLKGFAVIFMILVHSFEKFLHNNFHDNLLNKIALLLGSIPAAPVFMIVMGYFIWFSNKNFKYLILRGIKLILLGLLLNILLNLNLLVKTITGKIEVNIFHYIFGVDILFLAGFSVLLLSFLKFSKYPKILTFIIFILYLILISIGINIEPSYSINDYFLSFIFKVTEWSYFPLIPWFIYPLFGFMWAQNKKILKYFNPSIVWRIILLVIFFTYVYFSFDYLIDISNNLNMYYNHNIKFVFYTLLFISGYWLFLKQLNVYFNNFIVLKFIRYLGSNVTLIYIIQWIIIGNLATEYLNKFNELYTLLIFVFVTLISTLLTYYLEDKTRIIKF